MSEEISPEEFCRPQQSVVDMLKEALREVVFERDREKSLIFGMPRTDLEWPEVFVLMPFSDELKPVYEDHISKVALQAGLRVKRADNFFTSGPIMSDIWSAINAADIIVADLTGRNPNVFYETGLAHAIGKNTILLAQSIDDVPSDLRQLRIILYEFKPRGMQKLEEDLAATIRTYTKGRRGDDGSNKRP